MKTASTSTAFAGWYAIHVVGSASFWAAWWTAEPSANPWRTPDATGVALGYQPASALAAEAQRRIRAAQGRRALCRELDASWGRAASREANGKPPRYRKLPPAKPPPSYAEAWAKLEAQFREDARRIHEARRTLEALRPLAAAEARAFRTLGLEATATADEIRRAYRKIIAQRRLHPDQGGAPGPFRALTGAHEVALAYVGRAAR
jgi:hypothetical protein